MLVCSSTISFHFLGLLSSIASTLVFVVQNIFSKTVFQKISDKTSPLNMDKMNFLFYSYSVSFVLLFPVWAMHEGHEVFQKPPSWRVLGLLAFNGVSHYAQNVVAFNILAMVSPVTYSIASLIKRIFVIFGGILILGDTITPLQSFGILMTFVGLYLYDSAKHSELSSSDLPLHNKSSGN